jgi:hypothetical protein
MKISFRYGTTRTVLLIGRDRVKIQITRARRPTQARNSAPDPRFGPERRIDDPKDNAGNPNIMFVDTSMKWTDFGDDSHLEDSESPLPSGVMCYVQRDTAALYKATLSDDRIDALAAEWRTACFNKDNVKLPPFSGATYRRIERGMPLPFRGVDTLNLSIKLGTRKFQVREGSNLKKATSAEKRLEKAQAAMEPDATLIAALEQEVHESSFASGRSICREDVVPQLWFTHAERDQRDLWRDYGFFQPKIQTGSYSIAVDSPIHFEPFNLADTDNFKVVRRINGDSIGTFDSPEVSPEKLRVGLGSKQCKIFLVPQLWRFVINYKLRGFDDWSDHQPVEGIVTLEFSQDISDSGYMPAMSSPFVVSGWETPINAATFLFTNHPAYLHAVSDTAYNPQDSTDASFLRFMMQLSLFQRAAALFSPHTIEQEPHTEQPPSDPFFMFYSGSGILAHTNASAIVTQEGTPAKALVGAVEFADNDQARYFIYRKTPREIEPVTIYSGPYDDPGYNNVVTGSLLTPFGCQLRVVSADWTGTHPDNRWEWSTGGLCADNNLWTYLMQPRWCET